ncbi:MAG: endonuclease III [Anaerolineae bacterium]
MRDEDIHAALAALREAAPGWDTPLVDAMAARGTTPFRVLAATILSLRTQDRTTAQATPRLFALADTPQAMLALTPEQIEAAIYPVGFYRNKARTLLDLSRTLVEDYGGEVPDDLDTLLTLPGVGRKTANLVLTAGYNKPGICVDTHVHRITNRWGYVQTKTPEQTEMALREKLPPEYWIEINTLLVALGQNICHPTSPRCSICPVRQWCDRVGVTRSR